MSGNMQGAEKICDGEAARLSQFAAFAAGRHSLSHGDDYHALWQWSVDKLPDFWRAVWDFFDTPGTTPLDGTSGVLADAAMPGARWFPGVNINYADAALRHSYRPGPAIIGINEDGLRTEIAWRDLPREVAAVAENLRSLGVGRGDTVAAYLPDVPQAIVAFLATAALGAIWSGCGTEYAPPGAAARLAQLRPKVLFTSVGYRYNGRWIDKRADNAELQRLLPGSTLIGIEQTYSQLFGNPEELRIEPVPFDHPLWVLFSSGTTGRPKGIVHGHGGIVLEHLKALGLHGDLGPGDIFFWQTALSWMMWNFRASGLLVGATVICYSGNPLRPDTDSLWQLVAEENVTYFGTSPAHLQASRTAGLTPGISHDLSGLKTLASTGSSLPGDVFTWIDAHLDDSTAISSMSGGTDVCTAFAGGTPGAIAAPGELAARYLGVDLHSWDHRGTPHIDGVGELVVLQPMPSMPVSFWNDNGGSLFRAAYFNHEWIARRDQNVWRHGDWATLTARGSLIIHGRSDATLNRLGIRMGSADIYQIVEAIDEVNEAFVVGVDGPGGSYWMPLFVTLAAGAQLDGALTEKIRQQIRTNLSPRHVPDEVIEAPLIPHTRTGKKLEVPITALLAGHTEISIDLNSIDNPEAIDWYREQGRIRQRQASGRAAVGEH